ncbi:MAG: 50S ribosomal protein L10 [Chloroflexota bacterium]|nr:50S ribosomal protein L10 [Chloroflexota bacterium]
MPNKQNVAAVDELKDKLSRSQLTLIGEYRGLTVSEMSELRNAIRKTDAEVIVTKNTLTKIAANEVGITGLDEFLGGPVALTLAYGDPVATAKALNDYLRKAKKAIPLRGGMMGTARIAATDLERVASTPSREQSIARIMGGVNAPASRIVGALNGVMRNIAYILGQHAAGQGSAGGAATEA